MAHDSDDEKYGGDDLSSELGNNGEDEAIRAELAENRMPYNFEQYKVQVNAAIVATRGKLKSDEALEQPKLTKAERASIEGLCADLQAGVDNTALDQRLIASVGNFQKSESKMLYENRYAQAIFAALANLLMLIIPVAGWAALACKGGFFSMSMTQATPAGELVSELADGVSQNPGPTPHG